MSEPQKQTKTADGSAANVKARRDDYDIGYGKPPKDTRFQPGQSGNLKGRPKGSLNLKTVVEQALKKSSDPAQKKKPRRKTSKLEAIVDVHVERAEQGDHRSTNAVLKLIETAGAFKESNDSDNALIQAGTGRLSETLVEGINITRLTREQQIELSRLAEIINQKRTIAALAPDDLLLLYRLMRKGLGMADNDNDAGSIV